MNRERALKVVLVLVGLIFLLGVYPLMMVLCPTVCQRVAGLAPGGRS
jgi:hypothetical protein